MVCNQQLWYAAVVSNEKVKKEDFDFSYNLKREDFCCIWGSTRCEAHNVWNPTDWVGYTSAGEISCDNGKRCMLRHAVGCVRVCPPGIFFTDFHAHSFFNAFRFAN